MKVFVAGATGAIGTQLVPQLVAAGHDVTGMTRSPGKTGMLRALGARTEIKGASNAKAKRELGWQPRWSTWRLGFAKGLGD